MKPRRIMLALCCRLIWNRSGSFNLSSLLTPLILVGLGLSGCSNSVDVERSTGESNRDAESSPAVVQRSTASSNPDRSPQSYSRKQSLTPHELATKPTTAQTSPEPKETGSQPSQVEPATDSHEQRDADDLAALSDEFDDPKTIANWLRVYQVEKTNANQLERFDIGRTERGKMTLMPFTSSWFRDWRGVLVHKRVRGDFVVTTRIRATGRSGNRPPARQYSLAGIMVRSPRNVTPATWQPGGENYIFLSFGTADKPGRYQFEVKTTINSDSKLEINDTNQSEALIRVARIGAHFILLRKSVDGGEWKVHRRYHRPNMPKELQIGMTVYTDWQGMQNVPPPRHNRTVIRNGNPDLIARFDYFRFQRPQVSAAARRRALSNPREVPDGELLRLLNDANRPPRQTANVPTIPTPSPGQ